VVAEAPKAAVEPPKAPVEAPKVEPPAPVAAPVNGMSIQTVAGADPQFIQVLEHLKDKRPALVSFLDLARVRVEGTTLRLTFEQPFYVEALRQPDNERALKEALKAVLGDAATYTVGSSGAESLGGDSLMEMREKERLQRDAERLARVKEHPSIKLAVEIFGARIKDVKAPDA
jgi:hypothetical protein